MNFRILNIWLRLKLAVLFFLAVTLAPVIATGLDGVVILEEKEWSPKVEIWKTYISQNPTFSKLIDPSSIKEMKELTLPSSIGLYLI